ncbi:putative RNA-binding protein 19 [Wickerhamomyces ciferrii]|uniref:RNA-binding protein 19 n=1 Tax=Wickerhamomyces ciferrii (strain ATCC 14091 / BCRC 22168 / CBS 111 / JCM 3599 / NBRC 0793 / NRRL Y-1031 F-60-10) TaxID=1206466 RepID=K0KJL6_WICCF|nr:putative RNA-binding protein 19 [Wickerhamomyces ciferrii]CCH43166.1 putative RNA-binding protein 19 [Wickerhamomyces ciferrii]
MSCHPEPYILELYPGNEDNGCDSTDSKNVGSNVQSSTINEEDEDENQDQTQYQQDETYKDHKKIYSIHIYNLPPWIKWRDLKSLLISYVQDTEILHIQIWQTVVTNALVSLTSQDASIDIYNNLNNFEWNGFILTVGIEDIDEITAKINSNIQQLPSNQYHGYPPYPPQYLAPPQHQQSVYPQNIPPQPPQSSNSTFSPPPYYNFIPIYPGNQGPPLPAPPPGTTIPSQPPTGIPPTGIPPTANSLPPPTSAPHIPHVPQQIPQIPPPPGPFQHPYLSPPQQHQLPFNLQFPPHTPISRPSSKTRHPSLSISSPYYTNSQLYPNQQNFYGSVGHHTRSQSASFSSYSYNTSSQSPKIPSRQINLKQLNYHDITDINDLPADKTRLFIGNIPFESDWRDLKDFLRRFGDSIIRVEIPRNDSGSKGFGIATFENEFDALRVIEMCNGSMFQGRPLTVRYDKFPRVKNPLSSSSTSRLASPGKTAIDINEQSGGGITGGLDKENIIPEEHSAEISFDDGEFATEARNLVESLNLNSLK